jgi:murein DD-endopeptidase MepM/ murein hydrolase activator NlpD
LKAQKADLNKYISGIDKTMSDLEDKIHAFEGMILQKEADIQVKQQELDAAMESEVEQYDSMKKRIQYMYENGERSYIEALLQAGSFSTMLNRAEYVEQITAYDNQLLQEYIMQREYIALCKEVLEQEKITLGESMDAVAKEKENLETIRAQKAKDLAAYEDNIALTAASIKELEADLKYQTDLIASLEKEITEEQYEILKQNGITLGYDGSGFANPAPSYTVITSNFGWRSDPFTGLKAYHNGIDMAAAKGTPIVAAYTGIVGEAGYNSSMGNYIYLEHGDGLRTIYLHASKLYVKKDDVVIKGETIGAVGSTGRSTGPHLHFSVRLNGEYVSPWNYLSK